MIKLENEMEAAMWLPLYVARLTKQEASDVRKTDKNNKNSGWLIGEDDHYVVDYDKINADAATVADNAIIAFRERTK